MSKNNEPTTFVVGDPIEKTTGDYIFTGIVVGVVHKRSGAVRYIVEDDRGLLLIMSEKQLQRRLDKGDK